MAVSLLQVDDAALAAIVPKFGGITAADLSGCARINVGAAKQLLAAHCPRLRHVDTTWAGSANRDAGTDDADESESKHDADESESEHAGQWLAYDGIRQALQWNCIQTCCNRALPASLWYCTASRAFDQGFAVLCSQVVGRCVKASLRSIDKRCPQKQTPPAQLMSMPPCVISANVDVRAQATCSSTASRGAHV